MFFVTLGLTAKTTCIRVIDKLPMDTEKEREAIDIWRSFVTAAKLSLTSFVRFSSGNDAREVKREATSNTMIWGQGNFRLVSISERWFAPVNK